MGFFSEQPAVQDRLHRPLSMVGSGGPAASTFCESLADADAAALKRLRFALLDHFNMGYLNEIGPRIFLKTIERIKKVRTFAIVT